MKVTLIISLLLYNILCYGQDNCFIYPEGSGNRKACELSYKAIELSQGSKESQLIFDAAIAIGPEYAWTYYEKSVPYFKRGFLTQGLHILNKAVKLKPLDYLCYRAYWYWQYQNYNLCIQDLETYYSLPKSYQQFTPGGEKDMRLILGLAYAKNNKYAKAIKTIEDCINSYESEDDIGLADYHSLGILYLKNKQYDNAINTLTKQLAIYDMIPDSYFFLGLAYKGVSDFKQAQVQFNQALIMFKDDQRYPNPNAGFRIYASDVEKEIDK
ncbi:hypothetical protein GCM10022393_37540 [Aquimarina addita]|uniref:Tetratricopeptide repeat protein n=1 Tax=Aquimarina addita TaxID=870485 RepID=A0ABP6UU87_9FLAO